MNFERRKRYILERLEKEGSIMIQEMAMSCQVSEITTRRDLAELEKSGLLVRMHGGAIMSRSVENLFSFDRKALQNKEKKIQICKKAATYLSDNDILYIDCGTTVFHLVPFLKNFNNLRVITNSLPVVSELQYHQHVKVYLIGGELDPRRKALYGPLSMLGLEKYRANKAFIGASGITISRGISSNDEKEALITLSMARTASEVYLLCDSSKFEKDAFYKYADLSLISSIITDDEITDQMVQLYKKNKINIIISEPTAQ
jgi:DeoR family transcriptional regulator, fructose operon transcriptional repressor